MRIKLVLSTNSISSKSDTQSNYTLDMLVFSVE
jgi:hypothetical protein